MYLYYVHIRVPYHNELDNQLESANAKVGAIDENIY